jgi:hypothetical protein
MPVLTDSEYEELRPHRDVLDLFNQVGQIVSTAPTSTVVRIFVRINPEQSEMFRNPRCADCIHRAFHLMNEYIKDYENGKR